MEPNIAIIAGLIGEPSRARIVTALMGGKALTATELALEADVTAQTASSHLTKLVESQLIIMRKPHPIYVMPVYVMTIWPVKLR